MIVRSAQLAVFESRQYVDFENRTAKWLECHFPEDCAMLGENGVRNRIRLAVQVAAGYGLTSQRDTSKYVFLCFLLGQDFDISSRYQWLKAILGRRQIDPGVRMNEANEELAKRLESGEAIRATADEPR